MIGSRFGHRATADSPLPCSGRHVPAANSSATASVSRPARPFESRMTRIQLTFRPLTRLSVVLALIPLTAPPPAAACAGQTTPGDGSPIELTIEDTVAHVAPAPDRVSTVLRVALTVRVRNRSDQPVQVSPDQFSLHCGEHRAVSTSFSSPTPFRQTRLDPQASSVGSVWFTHHEVPEGEPQMQLVWQDGRSESVTHVSVDDHLRAESAMSVERLGPDGCLAVLRTRRRLDPLSVWLLSDHLGQTGAAGCRRLVISVRADNGDRMITDDVFQWLLQAGEHVPEEAIRAVPFEDCPAQFLDVHLAGVQRSADRRRGQRDGIGMHGSEASAVSAALRPVYRRVPVAQVLSDVTHEHPGVREAALTGAMDRLSIAEVRDLLNRITPDDDLTRRLIAEELYRLPDDRVLQLLVPLARHPAPDVADAAIRSLTRCTASETASVLRRLRDEHPHLRHRIAAAAIQSDDDRWVPLITDHAIAMLQALSVPDSDSESAPLPPDDPVDPNAGTSFSRGMRPPPVPDSPPDSGDRRGRLSSLREVLEFTDPERLEEVLAVAAEVLPDLKNTAAQDDVAMFLVQHDHGQYSGRVKSWIADRLQQNRVTSTVGNLIQLYPNPEWTEHLLALSQDDALSASRRQQLVQHALRCASSSQLELFVDRFPELDIPSQGSVLTRLADANRPGWRSLADRVLATESGAFNQATEALHSDSSEASIAILIRHLQNRLDAINREPGVGGDRVVAAKTLIIKLALISHPESRRVLNRCLRSSHGEIRHQAMNSLSAVARRSPANSLLPQISELRRAGEYEQALEVANECVAADQLFAEGYLFRATVRLRLGDVTGALGDLQIADGLSPEDTGILVSIALARVRLGELDAGLELARSVLQMDPEDVFNQYNVACVFARAAEQPDVSPSVRGEFVARAFELLFDSVSPDEADLQHVLNDHDLAVLHDQPQWTDYVNAVRAAEQQRN